ncbi:MAG: phosphocholine cytidylyltransferase family protein [Oscillospiraceae bacterium]|nr:phosphocholine cytidylyltransferase family protein [Oscillospiraceae bacterium]
MSLTRCEFEILSFLEREGDGEYPVRTLADTLCLSGTAVTDGMDALGERALLRRDGGALSLTEAGLAALEPYRVRRAVIVAAGFGSRMMPATADRPKPMVRVNGVRIIDTLLDALAAAGIREITVVGGYRIDRLRELLEKYPFLRILDNTRYEEENNISSALLARDYFYGGCYFCEADLYLTNPALIRKYQYASNILGSWSLETDDWCFDMKNGCASDYKKGGRYCYNYYGISYWTAEDCEKLKRDWAEVYREPGGKDLFWEFAPLVLRKERYRVEIRPCRKQDVMEIDNYFELAQLDSSYR